MHAQHSTLEKEEKMEQKIGFHFLWNFLLWAHIFPYTHFSFVGYVG